MDKTRVCSEGQPSALYCCRFCDALLHRGDEPCLCSTYRALTSCWSLCIPCAEAIDALTADTLVGKIHRDLVNEALMKYMRGSD